jgi:hypothetical protein
MSGGAPSVGPFTQSPGFTLIGGNPGITGLEIEDSSSNSLVLTVPTQTAGSMVGYMGGPLSIILATTVFVNGSPEGWQLTEGALTPAVTRQPRSRVQ